MNQKGELARTICEKKKAKYSSDSNTISFQSSFELNPKKDGYLEKNLTFKVTEEGSGDNKNVLGTGIFNLAPLIINSEQLKSKIEIPIQSSEKKESIQLVVKVVLEEMESSTNFGSKLVKSGSSLSFPNSSTSTNDANSKDKKNVAKMNYKFFVSSVQLFGSTNEKEVYIVWKRGKKKKNSGTIQGFIFDASVGRFVYKSTNPPPIEFFATLKRKSDQSFSAKKLSIHVYSKSIIFFSLFIISISILGENIIV